MLQYVWGTFTATILIRGARQLLTLRGPRRARRGAELNELGIIADGALLIRDGIIEQIGPSRMVENLAGARDAVEINAAGRVVMPGFVDSHTHLVFPPPGDPLMDLARCVRTVRTGTAKRLAYRTRGYLNTMARHGTTTVEAKTGCALDDRAEYKLLRVLRALNRDPVEVVPALLLRMPEDPKGEDGFTQFVSGWYLGGLLPRIRARKLANLVAVAWEQNTELHPIFQRWLQEARALGFRCKIHADQEGAGPAIQAATDHLVLSVDHLEHASEAEAGMMAGSPTIATLLPYPTYQRRSRPAPARALIDAGVAVPLASDFSPSSTPNLNMQVVVALACRHMGLTPAEAIHAATINGAHALNCGERTGSLEVGKPADLIMLNISDYREMAQHFGTNLVHLTMKRGEFIYQEGDVAKRTVSEVHPHR